MDALLWKITVLFSVWVVRIYGSQKIDLAIQPQHVAVTIGSRVKFKCLIPKTVPDENPNTRFWIKHNGTKLKDDPAPPEFDKTAYAAFDKVITSETDAGVYTCVVSKLGDEMDANRTEINGTVLVVKVAHASFIAEVGKETELACLNNSTRLSDYVVMWDISQTCNVDVSTNTKTITLHDLTEVDNVACYVMTKTACDRNGSVADAVKTGAAFEHRPYLLGFEIIEDKPHEVCASLSASINTTVNISWELANGTVVGFNVLNISHAKTSSCISRTEAALELVILLNGREFRTAISLDAKFNGVVNIGMVVGAVVGSVVLALAVVVILVFVRKKTRCCQEHPKCLGGCASHKSTAKNRDKEQPNTEEGHTVHAKNRAKGQPKAGADGSRLITTEQQPKADASSSALSTTVEQEKADLAVSHPHKTDDKQVIQDEAHAHWTVRAAMNWSGKKLSFVVHYFRGPSADSTNAGIQAQNNPEDTVKKNLM